jgi:hypothetical protein
MYLLQIFQVQHMVKLDSETWNRIYSSFYYFCYGGGENHFPSPVYNTSFLGRKSY